MRGGTCSLQVPERDGWTKGFGAVSGHCLTQTSKFGHYNRGEFGISGLLKHHQKSLACLRTVPIFSASTGEIYDLDEGHCLHSLWGRFHLHLCCTAATFPGSSMTSPHVPTTTLCSRRKASYPCKLLQASGFRDTHRRGRSADAGMAIPTSRDAQDKGIGETQPFTAQCICTSDTWGCLQSGAAAWSGVWVDEKPWKLSSLLLWYPGLIPTWTYKQMAGLYRVCRAIRSCKVSSCRRQTAPGLFGRSYSYTSLYNKFRIGSDFLKHSIKTYWKGWIFPVINKEMIPLWVCKLLLSKWPGLWGAVNVHKIDTETVCLLHSKANTAATLGLDWSGVWNIISPFGKRECCADLMVSPKTSTLHTDLTRSQREIDTGLSHFSGENFTSSLFMSFRLSLLWLLSPFPGVDVCCLQ